MKFNNKFAILRDSKILSILILRINHFYLFYFLQFIFFCILNFKTIKLTEILFNKKQKYYAFYIQC